MAVKSLDRLLLLWATLASVTTVPPVVEATPAFTTTSYSSYSTTKTTATTSSSTASASGFTLSSDITDFIPSCALSCSKSFIEANFNTSICGTSPSLQCLCQHTGSSGYTIGEGATECIVAEANVGNCEGDDSSSETVANAYGMCDNQPNAAPETHATLTATLVVISGSVFVPDTRTTTWTVPSNTSSTAILSTTSTASTATPTSTLATSTSTSPTSTAVTTGTTTTSTPEATAAAASSSLSKAQVGGIAGGVVAAAAILAALLALFILLRRRRRGGGGGDDSGKGGFARMRDSSWSPKRHPHLQGSPGSIPAISAPKYEEPKVMSFTRALAKRVSRQSRFGGGSGAAGQQQQRPGTIGLAISPAGASVPRRMTRWPGDGSLVAANVAPAWTPPAPVIRRYSPEPSVDPAMSPGRAVSSFNFFPQSPPQPQHGHQSPRSPPQQQQQQQFLQPPPLTLPQPTHSNNNHPSRPNLTVAIPPPKPKRASITTVARDGVPQPTLVATNGRESIVTEFAEDGEDMTSALGSAQIWRPPNTDPNSAATYYVADKWGNWVLGGRHAANNDGGDGDCDTVIVTPPEEPAELETPISKTVEEREAELARQKQQQQRKQEAAARIIATNKDETVLKDSAAVRAAMRHLSSPTIPESVALTNLGSIASGNGSNTVRPSPSLSKAKNNNNSDAAAPLLRPTIRLVTPESGRLPVNSRSSSVYSTFSLPQQQQQAAATVVPGADNPMPAPPAGARAVGVTASKRASRAFPVSAAVAAAAGNPAEPMGIHPALRGVPTEQQSNNGAAPTAVSAKPAQASRRRSNSWNVVPYSGRRDRSQTMMSQDSTTTIASSVGESVTEAEEDFQAPSRDFSSSSAASSAYYYGTTTNNTTQRQSSYPVDLSPVIESPGRSPVRYPQIPRSRSSAQMYGAPAPTPTPAAATTSPAPAAAGVGQRPVNPAIRKIQNNNSNNTSATSQSTSSDSPTLGLTGSQRVQAQMGPSSVSRPPKRSSLNPDRNPGVVRTGSPDLVGPDALVVRKQARHQPQPQPQPQPLQQQQPASQSSSPSLTQHSGQQFQQQQQQQQQQGPPHPQSFQTRINNRSQLPSQSHSSSRYGPSSVYDVYNDPTTSRPESHAATTTTTANPTPVIPTYQAFQKQTSFSPPLPPTTTAFKPSSPPPSTKPAGAASAATDGSVLGANSINSSALLSKRLGPEKAAAFQVPVVEYSASPSSSRQQQQKWTRRKSSLTAGSSSSSTAAAGRALTTSPPAPPHGPRQQPPSAPKGIVVRKAVAKTPTNNNNNSSSSNDDKENRMKGKTVTPGGGGGVDYEGQGYRDEIVEVVQFLPATPGWKPQLTPKRKGDNLYLSVQ